MSIPVTVTVTKKVITAQSVGAKPSEFAELVPSGSIETVAVQHDAKGLLPKEIKELAAFCAFARQPDFQDVVVRLVGALPGPVLKLEIYSSAQNEDPPDLVLMVGQKSLAIEVTDFPPDQMALQQAMAAHDGAAPTPLFHESGCSPDLIKQFMAAGVSLTEPHVAEISAEIVALYDYVRTVIQNKDANGKSELLLLFGPIAFEYPEADVIDYVVKKAVFISLKAVVFVRQNKSNVYWTHLA